jgi:hypothetical protein
MPLNPKPQPPPLALRKTIASASPWSRRPWGFAPPPQRRRPAAASPSSTPAGVPRSGEGRCQLLSLLPLTRARAGLLAGVASPPLATVRVVLLLLAPRRASSCVTRGACFLPVLTRAETEPGNALSRNSGDIAAARRCSPPRAPPVLFSAVRSESDRLDLI